MGHVQLLYRKCLTLIKIFHKYILKRNIKSTRHSASKHYNLKSTVENINTNKTK